MKLEVKEFPDVLDVEYDREESRMTPRFWPENWKNGVAIN